MHPHRLFTLFSSAVIVLSNVAMVLADCQPSFPLFCAGTSNNRTLNSSYICGDARLGPAVLPAHPPSSSLLDVYKRFGGLCPGEFLATYYDASSRSWTYPPSDGFQYDTAGEPIAAEMTLPVDFLVDRFGSEYGSYVSPATTPFAQRALPPSSLNTPAGNNFFPYNYHVYRVIQSFEVLAGPTAAWFGQPGQGVQYILQDTVLSLVGRGFLERVNLTLAVERGSFLL